MRLPPTGSTFMNTAVRSGYSLRGVREAITIRGEGSRFAAWTRELLSPDRRGSVGSLRGDVSFPGGAVMVWL